MHKLYLSLILIFSSSIFGMDTSPQVQFASVSKFHTVAQEVTGAGGAITGGAVGAYALTTKPIALLALKYGSAGCLAGANAIPLLVGGGAFVGYCVAKGLYNSWASKK